ncbi:hypothetical protein MRY87_09400 [bacterium]|nr:hypothetical protein [bacterium]
MSQNVNEKRSLFSRVLRRGGFRSAAVGTALAVSFSLVVGCTGGDSTSDNGTDFSGLFVANDQSVGTIDVRVTSTRLPVSQTSPFSVAVRNQDGVAVPNISVFCDSEIGIGIIEPTAGQTLTNANGEMSGIIGCEAPGSFQFACRLPSGTNLRQFVQIVCEGPVPAGFAGFAGAAGGTLGNQAPGGGVDVGDDGDPGGVGTEGIRLTEIGFSDDGNASPFGVSTFSIDTQQVNCEVDPAEDPECEPFFDTVVSFRIVNNSNQSVQVRGYNYTIPDHDGAGTTFTSDTIAPTSIEGGETVTAFGGNLQFAALFAEVRGSVGLCGAEKRFAGAAASMPDDLGFRNVTVRVFGENEVGESFTVTGRIGMSFDSFDNCGN